MKDSIKKRLELIKAKLELYTIKGIDSEEDLESIKAELDEIKQELEASADDEKKGGEDSSSDTDEAVEELLKKHGIEYSEKKHNSRTGDLETDVESLIKKISAK